MSIRTHLFLLALCAMLPVVAVAIGLSMLLVDHDRATVRESAMERVRAVMTAVDAELRGSIRTLEELAASDSLARDDFAGFHSRMMRAVATQGAWLNVTLGLPSGQQQVNAALPFGAPLPMMSDLDSANRVFKTSRPAVGNVSSGAVLKEPTIPVRVPVMRDGQTAFVLNALVRPASFELLLQRLVLQDGWVIAILDAKGNFVARIPGRLTGSAASDSFREAVRQAREGWYRGTTVEGLDTYTAHVRSEISDWSVGLALPSAYVLYSERNTLWITGIGVPLSVLLALLFAWLFGGRIGKPLEALAATAGNSSLPVADGARFHRVTEIATLARALQDAGVALRERQQLIEREKEALSAADAAKDEFVAMLSHELRNPLAAMSAAAHLLRVGGSNKAALERAHGVIERQVRHMTRLVEDLLDINRVAMGKLALSPERFNLADLAVAVTDVWRTTGRGAARDVGVRASPAWVEADRARIEQVLSNLIDNALKFTPAGKQVSVEVFEQDGQAILRVADEGDGIAPADMAMLFNPFVQGQQGIDRGQGGLGLGLALVKGIVELHGGSVSAQSGAGGRGAIFTARLPAVSPSASASIEPTAPRVAAPQRLRVLIVEDNEDSREVLGMALRLSGHDVEEAANGADGIELAAKQQPDFALVDIGLPDISGYDVARRIRLADPGRRTLLIALTGYGQAEDQQRALAAGFDMHITKPVFPPQLEKLIVSLHAERSDAAAR